MEELLAAGSLAGATALQAYAADGLSVSYGCRRATFTNHTGETVTLAYGTPNSGDTVGGYRIAPGKSWTVTMNKSQAEHFGYHAETASGKKFEGKFYPGENLNSYCTSAEPSSKATSKASTKPSTRSTTKASATPKSTRGGLARTGA